MSSFKSNGRITAAIFGALAIGVTAFSTPASAAPLPIFPFFLPPMEAAPPPVAVAPQDDDQAFELPARLRRQVVNYPSREAPGTIIIDTPNTYLYLVLGNGQAMRYGIGIGRDGFTWSGTQTITRKAEWPAWTPPPQMIARQPYLPRHMARRPRQPARCPRDVSRRHHLPHPRHQRAGNHRHPRLLGLPPPHQRGRQGSSIRGSASAPR